MTDDNDCGLKAILRQRGVERSGTNDSPSTSEPEEEPSQKTPPPPSPHVSEPEMEEPIPIRHRFQ
jgi:hypothetical protein